ncbi:hypothetical protein LDENG_00047060 [Lucifuga dentata]|nr:hypothetical protein LDENG_00047060 [Lucifuga dentata]
MSGRNIRGEFLYNLPSSVMWRFSSVMDGLSDPDWTRFASEVLSDQTAVRLAVRKERRTDWVMNQWENRNGRVGELLDVLEYLQLLRARDIILSWTPNSADSGSLPAACGGVMCWSYEEVHAGTRGFSSALQVGEGGFGNVYRASLRNTNCAVKRLKEDSPLDWNLLQESFKTEVEKLSQFRHPNIVDLLGFSEGGGTFCLIYSYMENRSLEDQLHNNGGALSWPQRVSVVEGAATALQFLHHPPHPHTPLIHGDVKSSNILLDRHLVAKLADFGLARFARGSDWRSASQTASVGKTTTVRGTLAYLPVEYVRNGELGTAVDVYSFGVVLLEILTGRRALEKNKKSEDIYLKDLVEDFQEGPMGSSAAAWRELLDRRLISGGAAEPAGCMDVAALACRCLDKKRKKRPVMTEVFDKLQNIHNLVRRNTGCSSSPEHPPHLHSHLHHPIQSFPKPPQYLESSTGALCQQMSRLGPLEDTYQPLSLSASSSSSSSFSSSSSASFCSLTPPHPLHSSSSLPPSSSHSSLRSSSSSSSSSFAGPCETDESQGFSQYYSSSHVSGSAGCQSPKQANRTHSSSLSPPTRDQTKTHPEPAGSQFSQTSVPTEDQYNFPLQPSSRDRLGASGSGQVHTETLRSPLGPALTHDDPQHGVTLGPNSQTITVPPAGNRTLVPPGAQTVEGNHGGKYGMTACSSSVLMNPSKQRFLVKKSLYEEGRIQTPELLSFDDPYLGRNFAEIRGPEESDELDFLPSSPKN